MPARSRARLLALLTAAGFAVVVLALASAANHAPFTAFRADFANGELRKWELFGGSWKAGSGVLRDLTGGRGDKAVTGNPHWNDYAVNTDIRVDSDPGGMHWGDAGIILRVTDPAVGVDSYNGYYVGIGIEDKVLFIGRANYGWNRLATANLRESIAISSWYHLSVRAQGCYIEGELLSSAGRVISAVSYYDDGCPQRAGRIGVRTFSVQASWRDLVVSRSS